MNTNRFDFLLSNRFWALVLAAAGTVLLDPTFPTDPWYMSLGKFLGIVGAGFVGIRTVDRAAEKVAGE